MPSSAARRTASGGPSGRKQGFARRKKQQPDEQNGQKTAQRAADDGQPARFKRAKQRGEHRRDGEAEGIGVADRPDERGKLRAGREHRAACDGGEQKEQCAAHPADARPEARPAQAGKAGLPFGGQTDGQKCEQRQQRGKRKGDGDKAHRAVSGEKAHDFPPGGKARADDAAKQCQRAAKDVHKSPPFD